MRRELASIEVGLALLKLERALARKYRPDQPRVPAGSPDGGEWTSGGGSDDVDLTGSADSIDPTLTEHVIEAAQSGRRLTDEECWEQYQRDIFPCRMVGLPSCYAQAAERSSACLVGRPTPTACASSSIQLNAGEQAGNLPAAYCPIQPPP